MWYFRPGEERHCSVNKKTQLKFSARLAGHPMASMLFMQRPVEHRFYMVHRKEEVSTD